MKEKMMICPKAKECGKYCYFKNPHNQIPECKDGHGKPKYLCPACIPYEPATCPDCQGKGYLKDPQEDEGVDCFTCKGTGKAPIDQSEKHSVNGYIKKSPNEINKECTKCPHWEGFCMVKDCVKQPATQMPLICLNCGKEDEDGCTLHGCATAQRDTDMAWHNEQIKPMVNLLRQAKDELQYYLEGCDSSSNTNELIAKIYAVLEGK